LAASGSSTRKSVVAGAAPDSTGIGKVRMIQDVEDLSPELSPESFPELPIFGDRQIQVFDLS
jgi:hypothetical protein